MSLETGQPFTPLAAGRSRVSARQYNKDTELLHKLARSLQTFSLIDSSGLLTRRQPVPAGIATKVFVVVSSATGNGVYVCYEQKLLSAEWEDTGGDPKFDDKEEEPTEVEVLNLLEFNPVDTDYEPALAAGDLIQAWQFKDDEGTTRWISLPCVSDVRRAITTQAAPADTKITANLYDHAGVEITSGMGSEITVHCNISGGGNLDKAIPRLIDNQDIDVYCEQGIWRCTTLFQHWLFCEE